MGVNCLIYFPPDTRIGDVAKVAGVLAGLKPEKQMLSDTSYACRVDGAKCEATSIAEMASISLTGELIDGEHGHYTTWHWEPDGCDDGSRMLYPKAHTFWIAVGKRLVDFFGGSICYSDCGDGKPNHTAKRPRKANNPNDGKEWHAFQDEMLKLRPITKQELLEADEWASYRMEPTPQIHL